MTKTLPGERSRGPLTLLGDGRYLRLWTTGLMLGTTRWLEVLGLGLWALGETGSPLAVATMMFARMLPMFLLGVPMGGLADRLDRRLLLIAGVSAAVVSTTTLLVLAVAGHLAVWQVAVGAFMNGVAGAMEHPVRRALIADAVGLERIGVALSLDSATFNSTRMVGPLAGGAIYATLGLQGIYAASVAMYLVAMVALVTLRGLGLARGSGRGTPKPEPFLPSLSAGIAQVRGNAVLASVMGVTVIANLFGFSYSAMVPVIGEGVLGLSPVRVGVLMSMDGAGALAGALTLAHVIRAPLYGKTFLAGALLFLAMVGVFSLSAHPALSMAALFFAGAGIAGFGSMQSTILIAHSAPEARSRVMGVLVVCIGAAPAGFLLVGALADTLGAATALGLISIAGVTCTLLTSLRWPALWRAAG